MPITPVNRTKHTITPGKLNKAGIATWGDTVATWGDATVGWGIDSDSFVNLTKHTITPTDRTKN